MFCHLLVPFFCFLLIFIGGVLFLLFPSPVTSVYPDSEDYHYLNQGECPDLREVDDADEFENTKNALTVSISSRLSFFKILFAMLDKI